MHPRHLFAAALLSGLGLIATRQNARACAPSQCTESTVAPAKSGVPVTLPANAPALPYAIWEPSGPTPQTLHVLDGAGGEVATTTKSDPWWRGVKLLGFAAPLAAGTGYHLDYIETCSGSVPSNIAASRAFDVGPATPLPTSLGTTHGAGRVVGSLDVSTSTGSCYAKIQAVSIDVRLVPSPELLAWVNTAGFKVQVDGQEYNAAWYGTAKAGADGILVTKLHAACGTRVSGDDNGPTLGVHTVTIHAHVAGATVDPPPVTTTLNFSCTDERVEVDAGLSEDADSPHSGDHDAGSAGNETLAADNGGSGCACTATGQGANEGAGRAGALAIVAAALSLTVRAKKRGRSQAKH